MRTQSELQGVGKDVSHEHQPKKAGLVALMLRFKANSDTKDKEGQFLIMYKSKTLSKLKGEIDKSTIVVGD